MSGAIKTGGTAFPMQDPQAIHAYAAARTAAMADATSEDRDQAYLAARAEAVGGMTMRDHFAGLAMQAFLTGHVAHYGHENYWAPKDMAAEAYDVADAMLKVREGGAA